MKKHIRIACATALATAIVAAMGASAQAPAMGGGTLPVKAQAAVKRKVLSVQAPQAKAVDRFIVRYVDASATARSASKALSTLNAAASVAISRLGTASKGAGAAVNFKALRTLGTGAQLVRASRALSAAESDAFLAQLRSEPSVKYAQVDGFKHRLEVTPNDPQFATLQWDFTDASAGIGAPAAWDTTDGAGVVVAVLDTGYLAHRDLEANIVPGYDMISYYGQTTEEGLYPDVAGDGDGRDDDASDPGDWTDSSMDDWCGGSSPSSWHGTHVAGTIAAITNNGQDIAGVAHGAKVQPVRVLGHCGGTTSDIADGIIWASGGHVEGIPDNPNPAEVINMSLGGSGECSTDPATQEAIDGALSRGTVVVVAAGNNGDDAAYYTPASCKGVVTVGATGIGGEQSYFSNYGATVALSAPGGDATSGNDPDNRWIWSLGDSGATVPKHDNALIGMIGTSQASPHVAGTVALMQAAALGAGKPLLTPVQVKYVLRATAKPFVVNPPSSKPAGTGILDAAAAVYAATQDVSSDPSEVLTNRVALTGQTGAAGDGLLYQINVPAGTMSLNLRSYGGTGDVSLYVSRGTAPTTDAYERKSAKAGNAEAVVVTRPAAGTWYVRMVGEAPFANVSVMAIYQ